VCPGSTLTVLDSMHANTARCLQHCTHCMESCNRRMLGRIRSPPLVHCWRMLVFSVFMSSLRHAGSSGLTGQLAGMSKQQLYDLLAQMKVYMKVYCTTFAFILQYSLYIYLSFRSL